MNCRDKQIMLLKKSSLIMAFINALATCVPSLVLIASFSTYVLSGNELTGVKAFVTLNYMNILRIPFMVLPAGVYFITQAMVSLKRIDKFLNNEELEDEAIEHQPSEMEAIIIENGNFGWGTDEPTILEDVDIKVPKESLTAVSFV